MPSAKAVVNPGTDYLITPPGGATYNFPLPGGGTIPLSFGGLPIGTPTPNGPTPPNPDGGVNGWADTVVNRTSSVDPTGGPILNPITGLIEQGGVTPIEIVGLSLKGDTPIGIPVGLPGVTPGTYDMYAGLEKYYGNTSGSGTPSTGTMFIRDNGGSGKTWDSLFAINAVSFGVPIGSTLNTASPDFVRSVLQAITTPLPGPNNPYDCSATIEGITYDLLCLKYTKPNFLAKNLPWSDTPIAGQLLGDNLVDSSPSNFYITSRVPHEAPDATHIVDPVPVPSPLAVLGAPAALSSIGRIRKLSSILKRQKALVD